MFKAFKTKRPPHVYALVFTAGFFALVTAFLVISALCVRDVSEGAVAGSLYVASDSEVAKQLLPGFASMQNRKDVTLSDTGFGIFSNNIQLALCRTKEDAQWVLDTILFAHALEGTTASFVQQIRIEPSEGNLLGREEALLVIRGGTDSLPYVVQSEDNINNICVDFNMTQQEYMALNASGGTSLVPGQLINVKTAQMPLLQVKNVLIKTETKSIPYATQTVSDGTLFKGQTAIKQAGVNGEQKRTTTVTYIDGVEISSVSTDFATSKEPVAKIVRKGTKPPIDAAGAPNFRWPVSGTISSPFGSRWGTTHYGLDIAVPTGTSVKASAAGIVLRSFNNGDYGLFVEIDHGGGWITRYGHNSKLLVKAGDTVSAGQTIALSGSTGHSTGPHVHFEIRKSGTAKNPLSYLP